MALLEKEGNTHSRNTLKFAAHTSLHYWLHPTLGSVDLHPLAYTHLASATVFRYPNLSSRYGTR